MSHRNSVNYLDKIKDDTYAYFKGDIIIQSPFDPRSPLGNAESYLQQSVLDAIIRRTSIPGICYTHFNDPSIWESSSPLSCVAKFITAIQINNYDSICHVELLKKNNKYIWWMKGTRHLGGIDLYFKNDTFTFIMFKTVEIALPNAILQYLKDTNYNMTSMVCPYYTPMWGNNGHQIGNVSNPPHHILSHNELLLMTVFVDNTQWKLCHEEEPENKEEDGVYKTIIINGIDLGTVNLTNNVLSFSETNCTWIPGVMNAIKPYIISNSEIRVVPHVSDWDAVFKNSTLHPQKIEKFKKAFADNNITDDNLFDLTREQIEAFDLLSFKEKFSLYDFVESYNKSYIGVDE